MFNYSPGQVVVVFKGSTIGGFADGSMISGERSTDAYTKTVGADGEVTRVQSLDKSGEVTITLLQTSPSNDILSGYAVDDENIGTGIGELIIKDNGGTLFAHAPSAWVKKQPKFERAKEAKEVEWVIVCARLDVFVGGNPPIAG